MFKRVKVNFPITRPVLETGFFLAARYWWRASGLFPGTHGLKSELLDALPATSSATSALVEILLVRANLLPKAKRFSRFTFLNQPCHETTRRLFTFSLGLVEQFWLELPISPWPIPVRILDCWQVRSSLAWVPSRWCSTPLGDAPRRSHSITGHSITSHSITVMTVESSSCPGSEMERPTLRMLVPAIASMKGCTPP